MRMPPGIFWFGLIAASTTGGAVWHYTPEPTEMLAGVVKDEVRQTAEGVARTTAATVVAREASRVDSLGRLLETLRPDTTIAVPRRGAPRDEAYWDQRLDRIDASHRSIIQALSIIGERQKRVLCWVSKNCDVLCDRGACGSERSLRGRP